jgi:hypothetical protein
MQPIPLTPQLEATARRCVWFKTPAEALAWPEHFIAHVLTYGMHEDVKAVRQAVGDDAMREALDNAPAGIFDGRSWAYWHLILYGREDAPPLPVRRLDGQPQSTAG